MQEQGPDALVAKVGEYRRVGDLGGSGVAAGREDESDDRVVLDGDPGGMPRDVPTDLLVGGGCEVLRKGGQNRDAGFDVLDAALRTSTSGACSVTADPARPI